MKKTNDPRNPLPERRWLKPQAFVGSYIPVYPRLNWWSPSKRGTVVLGDLQDFGLTAQIARRMTDYDLHHFPCLKTGDRTGHAICAAELRRRESWVPRWALGISMLSLIVSVATALSR